MRLFAAIPLPEAVRDRMVVLAHMLPLPRRVAAEDLHLTLAFLGEVPDAVAQEAHYAFEAVSAPAFDLTIRGAGVFGGDKPRAIYAGVLPEPALDRLQAKVESAARRAGAEVERRRFVPHVTLARVKPWLLDVPRLERAIVDVAGFTEGPFRVDRFALFESFLGEGGAHYEELASYPLKG